MDPGHRDRIAFMRICSGRYAQGHAHVPRAPRQGSAHRRRADLHGRRPRSRRDEAYAGDIIGLHNHGTINIGDTLHRGRDADVHRHPELRAGAVPPRRAARSAAHEGAAEGPRAAVRGRRDAVVPPAAQQRPDPRRRRPAAVRRRRVPAAGRIRRAVRASRRDQRLHRALGVAAQDAKKLEEFRDKAYDESRASTTPARSSTSRRRASTCS